MLGKIRGPVLLTIVDRVSRKVRIKKVDWINSWKTHKATCAMLKRTKVHTITNDNGPEFDRHKETAKTLRTKVYFNHPYSSWQRGTNENTNGLIRQYFGKGTDFNLVSETEIARVESLLNNRPRKTLGYRTPNEVERFMNQMGVALST
jgi:IS30 family transposase